jgi:hypothetical protein
MGLPLAVGGGGARGRIGPGPFIRAASNAVENKSW